MGLVDYSDSDTDEAPVDKSTAKTNNSKFQKVVDRSNPGKIKVSLPEPIRSTNEIDEHPAKRVKTGGGGYSDFKSFLPPPKQRGQSSISGIGNSGGTRQTGITPGVSIKRELHLGSAEKWKFQQYIPELFHGELNDESMARYSGELNLPAPKRSDSDIQKPAEEVKLVGKPLMFKPLSVNRKPVKKKKNSGAVPTNASSNLAAASTSTAPGRLEEVPRKPAVSLFAITADLDTPTDSAYCGEYQPIIHGANNYSSLNEEEPFTTSANFSSEDHSETAQPRLTPPIAAPQGAQSLHEIASDLNLSAAERRQLFGRQKGYKNGDMPSATKIISFNTDEEYRHNDDLRAAGELAVHNPVRAIAPGKHSLRQLVNAAQSQKEALEESFALGKANRAEAGSKYGWGGSR